MVWHITQSSFPEKTIFDLISAILNLGFSDKINPIPHPKKIYK